MKNKLLRKAYRTYHFKFFRYINGLRGSHFIFRNLKRLAADSLGVIDSEPEPIAEKDWDVLIILDACRADFYEDVTRVSESRISMGSTTKDYISANFSGEYDFSDTVYISGNPHTYPGIFEDLTGSGPEDVFHTVFNVFEEGWSEEHGTVTPEPIIENALTAEKLFPDKKKIIHFMQPHTPFVNFEKDETVVTGEKFGDIDTLGEQSEHIYSKAHFGNVTFNEVRDAYRENLRFVLESLERIEDKFGGKIVVTADHGELLGEGGLTGHPEGSETKLLRKVPWEVR